MGGREYINLTNITEDITEIVRGTGLKNGIVSVFVPGSTGAITTIEYEEGLIKDFSTLLDRIAPRDIWYEHERAWRDGNGYSHVRAALLGPSITVPLVDGQLVLGSWQQLVFVELDVHDRDRKLIIQIIGE